MINRRGVIPFLLLLFAISCNVAEEKNTTEKLMDGYFVAIKEKDFDKALTFYGYQFFDKTPRSEWLETLTSINAKLGDLQSYALVNWRVQTNIGTALSGTYYSMEYRVNYSKYSANEIITLYKPSGTTEIKIVRHQINSPGFSK